MAKVDTSKAGEVPSNVDAFILYNDRETSIEDVVSYLDSKRITTYFWRRDLPAGAIHEELETEQLKQAKNVLVFLGTAGWGPNHLRLAVEATALNRRIIPIIVGKVPEDELKKAGGLFQDRHYLDLSQRDPQTLERLVAEIRRVGRPQNRELDGFIRALVDGDEEKRAETLNQIRTSTTIDKSALAARLRREITERFSLKHELEFASAERDPKKLPSIRSWMLSCLIWADAESVESRDFILQHLETSTERERNVRFWTLAGVYQRNVSYLNQAVEACASAQEPEVAALSRAISAPTNPDVHRRFRESLLSDKFETVWSVLRVLRVVPILELTVDVCGLLDQTREETGLAYDTFYALSNPEMAHASVKVLSETFGTEGVVERLIAVARDSNDTAARTFSLLLLEFDAAKVDRALENARKIPESKVVAEALQQFVRTHRRRKAKVVYESTFSAFVPDRSVYWDRARHEPLEDSLGVRVHAGHLAQLIAAKDTSMPLSIGLFGPWGSGKSHFIDLLDESLRGLSQRSGSVFHQHIVQIRFNAWHYLDTNLWANLVSEIFDQLFRTLDDREDTTEEQINKLKGQLAQQSALAGEAKEALKTAEAARVTAETKLRVATAQRLEAENSVGALLNDLKTLVQKDESLQKQLSSVADSLGLPKLQSSFTELEARALEGRSLEGRARTFLLAVFTGPGWWQRGVLLVAAVVIPVAVSWLSENGPQLFQDALGGASRVIAQIVAAASCISTWVSSQVKAGNSAVSKLEDAYEKVKEVRKKRAAETDAIQAETDLGAKRQAEEEARHTLHEAEEKMKAISAELAELAPGRQLMRFLKARASAEDYRRHLGLVSLVRKDFEQLSDLLMQAAVKRDPSLPRIDRIVLYIDDLDRCRADRVIEVLEAVHLLLAFPLFAVVVAVDPRWLRQSLYDHYPRLLGGADGTKGRSRSQIGPPATPQDYLEKIFQVPFNLQRMEKTGFDALVAHLFQERQSPTATSESDEEHNETRNPKAMKPEADPVTGPRPPGIEPGPATTSAGISTSGESGGSTDAPRGTTPPPQLPTPPQPDAMAPQPPSSLPDPKRLALTGKEVADIQRFQPLFQTPRAVKRLANTYSLIRVGVDAADWLDYVGHEDTPGIYRVPLLMLAVTSAFPSLARPWLLWLIETSPTHWKLTTQNISVLLAKNRDTTAEADWHQLARAVDELTLEDWPEPTTDYLEQWVARVARYSF